MQILTPTGYRNIEDCAVGDDVCAFDVATGAPIVNQIEGIDAITHDQWDEWYNITNPGSEPFDFYKINDTWVLFKEQSIWTTGSLVLTHAKLLQVGDTIYDDTDNPVVITSIAPCAAQDVWYRLHISGDHSYIADGLTLHNANRFWILGTATWDGSNTASWSTTTGGSGGASVPGSADTAIFDASSGGGTVTVAASIGGSNALTALTAGLFTGTLAFNTNNPSLTFSGSCAPGQTGGTGTRTINTGSGTFTFTGSNLNNWDCVSTTGLTPTFSNTNFVVTVPNSTSPQTFVGGAQSYGNLTVNGRVAAVGSSFNISGSNTFNSYTVTGNATLGTSFGTTQTVAAGVNWGSGGGLSTWVNAIGTGTFSNTLAGTIQWCIIRTTIFTNSVINYSNSIDMGGNSGAALGTFTPPSSSGGGGHFIGG